MAIGHDDTDEVRAGHDEGFCESSADQQGAHRRRHAITPMAIMMHPRIWARTTCPELQYFGQCINRSVGEARWVGDCFYIEHGSICTFLRSSLGVVSSSAYRICMTSTPTSLIKGSRPFDSKMRRDEVSSTSYTMAPGSEHWHEVPEEASARSRASRNVLAGSAVWAGKTTAILTAAIAQPFVDSIDEQAEQYSIAAGRAERRGSGGVVVGLRSSMLKCVSLPCDILH